MRMITFHKPIKLAYKQKCATKCERVLQHNSLGSLYLFVFKPTVIFFYNIISLFLVQPDTVQFEVHFKQNIVVFFSEIVLQILMAL